MDTFEALRAELAQVEADTELDMAVQAHEDDQAVLETKLDAERVGEPEDYTAYLIFHLAHSLSPLPVVAPKRGLLSRLFNRKA